MERRNSFLGDLKLFLFLLLAVVICPKAALAAYPEKPVTLICVWGPGAGNDAIARTIADFMKKYFPQPVVVINRAGGAGTIGTAEVAHARPDGYTIGSTTMSPVTINPHQMKLPYKTPDDYTPIALVGTQVFCLTVPGDSKFKTLQDLISEARAHPGKVRVNTAGEGHMSDLILNELNYQAKIDTSDIPAKGSGEQLALILGKHVEAALLSLSTSLPHVKAGKLRILAVSDEKRSPLHPEVPTFKELGYDITITTYTLLFGPKGLPPEITSQIQQAYRKVSEDADFLRRMEPQGITILYEGTEELKRRLWKDYNGNKAILERMERKKK